MMAHAAAPLEMSAAFPDDWAASECEAMIASTSTGGHDCWPTKRRCANRDRGIPFLRQL